MMSEREITDLLGTVTKRQMVAAMKAMNNYGFDISAPWECDQDDREFEMFCGLREAIAAALQSTG